MVAVIGVGKGKAGSVMSTNCGNALQQLRNKLAGRIDAVIRQIR